MPLLPLQVGGLALHFPITAGGTTHQHSLQERVRDCVPACLPRAAASLPREICTSWSPAVTDPGAAAVEAAVPAPYLSLLNGCPPVFP